MIESLSNTRTSNSVLCTFSVTMKILFVHKNIVYLEYKFYLVCNVHVRKTIIFHSRV